VLLKQIWHILHLTRKETLERKSEIKTIKQNLKDNCDELNKPVVSFKLNELHKIHIESIIFKLRL